MSIDAYIYIYMHTYFVEWKKVGFLGSGFETRRQREIVLDPVLLIALAQPAFPLS